jgi:hypothetical protein
MDTQMMVKSAPPKANDKKFPSMMPDDCFVLFQNSFESRRQRKGVGELSWNLKLQQVSPGVVFEVCCLSATIFFMVFSRSRKTSTDSFDKSSETIEIFEPSKSSDHLSITLPSGADFDLLDLLDMIPEIDFFTENTKFDKSGDSEKKSILS